MKINGNSGCDVKIINKNNKFIIVKSGNSRLLHQINKQIDEYNHNQIVKIPKVYNINYSKFIIEMEYIKNSMNIIDFMEQNNKFIITFIYEKIINLIDYYIINSKIIDVKSKFLIKYENTLNNISKSKYVNRYNKYKINNLYKFIDNLKLYRDIYIPVGKCHGDLTFSNVLVDLNFRDIYLIDFLDNFVETPLQDMVKIRQDTKYKWICSMTNFKYDYNKILIIFDELDIKFHNKFNDYSFYNKYYNLFQLLNIMRIIPYVNENNKFNNLLKITNNIIEEILN